MNASTIQNIKSFLRVNLYIKLALNKLIHIIMRETPSPGMRRFILNFLGAEVHETAIISYGFLLFDASIASNLIIKKNVSIGPRVTIVTHADPTPSELVNLYPIIDKPVIIEENVWIGANVTIIPGVKVGKYSVIAAGSVVIRDVPPYSVVAGVPARVVKTISFDGNYSL